MRTRVGRRRSAVWAGAVAGVLVSALLPQVASGAPAERYELAFVSQPTAVAASGATAPGYTNPVLRMCAAVEVEVRSAGRRVSSPSFTVSLASDAGLGGAALTATTVDGIARFGDGTCTGGLTAGVVGTHTITASARRATGAESQPFTVLQYLGDCVNCSVPELTREDTTASLASTAGSSTNRLSFGVGADRWTDDMRAACPTGNERRDQVVTVDLLGHVKTVTLRWSKAAVQLVSDNGSGIWPVCMAAQYSFPTTAGPAGEQEELGDLPGWYAGQLLSCRDVDRTLSPCVDALTKTKRGEQVAVVHLPNITGDPRFV